MKIHEEDIVRLWQSGRCRFLSGSEDNIIRIIYPGRRNGQPGGDFRDAVIEVNGKRHYGNVEIHVSSDLWYRHGHHINKEYNSVILQVVGWDTGRRPALRQDGRQIHTLILDIDHEILNALVNGCADFSPLVCKYAVAMFKSGSLLELLTVEGLARLVSKSDGFYRGLGVSQPEKIIYKGICRALGYASNTEPFEHLAEHLPTEFLNGCWQGDLVDIQAKVAGMAGLLPSQNKEMSTIHDDGMITVMEDIWAGWSAGRQEMERAQWNFVQVRPVNNPVRRVASLCALIKRYEDESLLTHFDVLIQSESAYNIWQSLEDSLAIGKEPYWRDHYDFGLKMGKATSLLGRGRAREIVVNCILPFFLAFYRRMRLNAMVARVVEIYCGYPSLPENTISIYMKNILFKDCKPVLNGCQHQGLLNIYYNYCKIKDCQRCPVSLIRS